MRCLTITETHDWMWEQSVRPEPYHDHNPPHAAHYTQFYTPKPRTYLAISSFASWLTLNYWDSGEALIHVWDWSLYRPPQMLLLSGLRLAHKEARVLADAPGHAFAYTEKDDFIALCSLTIAFEWQTYIYFADSNVTLFNYDGTVVDFWAEQNGHFQDLKDMIRDEKIEYTGYMKDLMMKLDVPAPKPVSVSVSTSVRATAPKPGSSTSTESSGGDLRGSD